MNHQIDNYITDNEDPIYNFELGLEYEKIGQTSSAISFFLRCAERSSESDPDLSYEALIHMGDCYDSQTGRGRTVKSCWRKALVFLPQRPEAYYKMSRLHNWNSEYDEAYVLSNLALSFCDFNQRSLRDNVNVSTYRSYLLFEKGLSSWWWGKVDESKETFLNLYQNHFDDLPQYQKNITYEYLKDKLKVI